MTLAKLPVDLPTFEVHPNGKLKGHTLVMRPPSVETMLALRGGTAPSNETVIAWFLDAVVDDTFDVPGGVRGLDFATILDLLGPWIAAWEESLLPPVTGRPSERPSEKPPSTRKRGR